VESSFALGALFLSILAMMIDLKTARVPNWLTAGGLIAGFCVRTCLAGGAGLETALAGALFGGGILFIPFLVRGIGGGDVKLMAAVSAWLGMGHAVVFILATAIAGGLLALGYLALRRQTGEALSKMARTIRFHLAVGLRPLEPAGEQAGRSVHLPYTLAIASGALFVFLSVSTALWR
jgi:prepilin peptidase CpaA